MRCKLTIIIFDSVASVSSVFFFLFYKLFVASVSYLSCDIARKPATFITEKKKGVETHGKRNI